MKKKIYAGLLLSTFFLAACQNESATAPAKKETTDATTEEAADQTAKNEDVSETKNTESEEVTYKYTINPNTFSVEPIDDEETDEKLVLLTFDDAPYGNAMEIAHALAERNVSALFFVNGMYMEDEEGFETIKNVHEMGFEIANHTHTHAKLDDYPETAQLEEITKTNEIIEEATGVKPRFFRAPHGVMTSYAEQVVADEHMTWMNWSFGYDWEEQYQDSAALANITLNTELLGDGANILMHDREWTAEAVPTIVDGLLEQGFTIVDPKLIINENEA